MVFFFKKKPFKSKSTKRRQLSQNTEVKILAAKRTGGKNAHRRGKKKPQMNITNCWKKRKRSIEAVDPGGCWAEMSRDKGNVAADKWRAIKTGTVKEKTDENKKVMANEGISTPPPPPMQTHWFPVDIRRRGTPTWNSTGGWGWRSLWMRGQGLSTLQKAYGDLREKREKKKKLSNAKQESNLISLPRCDRYNRVQIF